MAIEGGLTGIDGLRGLEPGLGSGRGTVTVVRMYKLVEHIVPINRGANNIKHVVNK